MTLKTKALLALLVGVDLLSVHAAVKISATRDSLKKARREMEAIRTKAQLPTSGEIVRLSSNLSQADQDRLFAQHRNGVLKIASPYEVFRLFLQSAARQRRRLAVAELLAAVSTAQITWLIWRLLSG